MTKNLDGAENFEIKMVDVLSTFLLQVTTVHSIDHDGMVKTFKGFRVLALPSICRILYATYDMWHIICGILYVAYHMWHTIYHIDTNYTI